MVLMNQEKMFSSSHPHPETLFWHSFWHTILEVYMAYSFWFYLIFFPVYTGIYFDILSEILSGIYSDILSGIYSGILSDILSDIYSGIPPGIFSRFHSGILSGIYSDILFDILSRILSSIYSDILSGILSDILSGVWLRSGSAHWDLELAVEVRQCPPLSAARGWGAGRQGEGEGGRDVPLIRSRDPHLASGEQLDVGVNNPQRTEMGRLTHLHGHELPL